MSHFLFAVEIPPGPAMSTSPSFANNWTQFENEANKILQPAKAYTRHQKNVFLLPVENGLPVLLALSSTAEKHNLAYSALLVEKVTDLSEKKSSGPSVRMI